MEEDTVVYAWYVDEAGKRSVDKTVQISNIDSTVPQINIVSTQGLLIKENATSGDVQVTISDEQSGIKEYRYTKDGVNARVVTSSSNTEVFTLTQSGTYDITVVDNAGNENTAAITIVDAPVITTIPETADNQTVNSSVKISVSGSDVNTTINNAQINNFPYDLTENGTYDIVAVDTYSNKVTKTIKIDKALLSAPTISYTPQKVTDSVEVTIS